MNACVIQMPWSDGADEARFRRLLRNCLLFTLVMALVMPWIPLPKITRQAEEQVPARFAEIVLKKPEPKPISVPVVPKPVVQKATKAPTPKTHAKRPARVVPAPVHQTVQDARVKASHAGILAFQDALRDMRQAADPGSLSHVAGLHRGTGKATTVDRSLLTSKSGKRRADVNLAGLSRETGGVALSARQTTVVQAHEEPAGPSGVVRTSAQNLSRARSIEDVRRVFDANKGAIYAIYNRALRQDPTLVGKMVLKLVIQPDGHVSGCRVVSSDIDDKNMVTKIVERVQMFDFGKADVVATTINYPVHFLPS